MAFISTKYRPVFTGEAMPRLTTLYRAETLYTSMPRTMHRHEDVAEFILITEGSGIHIIDGQRYYTQKGDLLLIGEWYEQRVSTHAPAWGATPANA